MAEASEINENTPASVLGADSTQRTPDLPESREFQERHISDMGVIAETDCRRQSSSPNDVSEPLGDVPNARCGGALEDKPILTDEDNHSEVMKTPENDENNMQYGDSGFSQLHDSNKENENRVSTPVSKDSSDNGESVISLSSNRFSSVDGSHVQINTERVPGTASIVQDGEISDSSLLISEKSDEPIDVRICSDKNDGESRLREQIEVSSEKTMLECSNTSMISSGITETSTESSEEGCISSSMENLAPSDLGETQHEVIDALENKDNHTCEENATENKVEFTKCKDETNTSLESGHEDANSSMEIDVALSSKSVPSSTSLVDDDKEEGELEEGELDDEDESVGDKEDAPTSEITAVGKSTSLCVQEKTLKKDDDKKASENLSDDRSHEEGRKTSTSPSQDRKRKQEDEEDGDRERRPNNSNSSKKKKLKHHQHYDSDEEDADGTGNKFRRGPSGSCDFDAMLQQMKRRTGGEEGADYAEEGHYTAAGAHRAGYRPGFGSYDSDAESPAPPPPPPYRGNKRGGGRGGGGSNRRSPALSSSKTDALCVHFLEGTCTKGDECQYSHNVNHAMVAPSHQRKPELCKFYMIGCCAKRQKCLYMHKDFPCKFYHTGRKCGPPDKCKFSHEPLSNSTRDILLRHIEQAPKDILGSFPRLTKAAAVWVVTITEAGRNKRSCAVDAWTGARDWRGKGFKYVDRALKSLDKKNRRAATASGQDPGGEDVEVPADEDCVNPNKIPLGNASKKSTVVGQSDGKPGVGVSGASEGAGAEEPVKRGGGVNASSAGEERGSDEDVGGGAGGRRHGKKNRRHRYSGYGGDGYEMEEYHKRRHDSHHNPRHRHNSQQHGASDGPKFGRNDREHKTDESEEDYENSNNQRRKRNRRSYERDDKLNSKDRLSFRDEDYPVASGVTGDGEQRSLEELMANMPAKQREMFQRVAAKNMSEDGEGKGYSRYKDNVSPTKKYKVDGKGEQERLLHQQHLTDNGFGGENAETSGGAHQSQRDDWYSSDDEAHDCSEGKSPRLMMDLPESKASLPTGNIAALLESIDRSKKAGGAPSNTGYYNNNASFGDRLSGPPSSGQRGVPEDLIKRSPSSVSPQSQTAAILQQQQQQQPPQHYDPFEMFRQQQQHELQKHREQERIKRERMSAAAAESSAMHHASQQVLSDGSFPREFFGDNRSHRSPSPVNQRIPPGTSSSPPSSSYPSAAPSAGNRQEPGNMAGAGCLLKLNLSNINVPSDLAKVLSDLQNQTKLLSKSAISSQSAPSTATTRLSAAPESAMRLGPHSLDDGERIARDPRRVRTQRDSSESQDSSDNNRDARDGFSVVQRERERSAGDAQEGSGSSRDSQGIFDPSANRPLFGGLPSARDPRQNRDSREEPPREMPGKQDPYGQNITDRSKGYPSYRDPRLGGRGTSYDADPRFFPSLSRHTQQQPRGSPDLSRIRSSSESSDVGADLTIDIDVKQQSSQHSSMYPGRSNVPFHVPEHDPVTVTNASITAHPPMTYRLLIVTIPKVSYAHITQRMSKDDPRVMEDPRLYRMFFGVQERGGSVSPVANAIPDNPQSPTSENSSPAPESRDPRMNRDPRMSESRNSDPRLITRELRSSGPNLDPRAADIEITNTDARNLDAGTRNADSRNNDPRLGSRSDTRLTAPRSDPRMGGNRDPRTNKILEEEPISSDPRVRPGILGPSLGRGMSNSSVFIGAAMAPHLGGHLPTSMTPHSVPLLASPINGISPVMASNMVGLHGPPPNQGVYLSHDMLGPHGLHRMAAGPNPYNPYTGMAQQPSGHPGLLSLPIGGDQGLLGMNECFPAMMAQQQQQHEGAMPNPYNDSAQHLYQRKKGHMSRDGDGSWSPAGGDGGYTGGHRRGSVDRWPPNNAERHPQDGDGGDVWSVGGHRGGNHDPRLKKNLDTMASFSPIL